VVGVCTISVGLLWGLYPRLAGDHFHHGLTSLRVFQISMVIAEWS
jgi:hypothetical protein